MDNHIKNLSNPFSTGGGGINFEIHVQAAFVLLMLVKGFVPCLPYFYIKKVKLQGRYANFDTDDMIVFLEEPSGKQETKLLAQIKHSVRITSEDKDFKKCISAAWSDFNKKEIFTIGKDAFALITGPLSVIDINDTRTILEWARYSEDENDFMTRVRKTKFSSKPKIDKLDAFRLQIKSINNDREISDKQLWLFMKNFHLLGYDLDIRTGVTLSLLHSLIAQYNLNDIHSLWSRIVYEVQYANQNAGTLDIESIPKDLCDLFRERSRQVIPKSLKNKIFTETIKTSELMENVVELSIVALIGGWDENYPSDKKVIEIIAGVEYEKWIPKIRTLLLKKGSPLKIKNGRWSIDERVKFWDEISSSFFDEYLDKFKEATVSVLTELNPAFELPASERFSAGVYGKILSHSVTLRKGLAESLALLGSRNTKMDLLSFQKAETTSVLTVREILANTVWPLWASLDNLLPLIAESAPSEFLAAVERDLQKNPCPFDELFAQENSGIFGSNYLTGVLWALETLAWNEEYLTRTTVALGGLADHDPGGNWANRPINSLSTIFLPWFPQTKATISQRFIAVETLYKEFPKIFWKLLLSLLPNNHQSTIGSHKPIYRDYIQEDFKPSVSNEEYWKQVRRYSEMAINIAINDIAKIPDLIEYIEYLHPLDFKYFLKRINSEVIIELTEEKRLPIWTKLMNQISRHRKYAGADWTIKPEDVNAIEEVAKKIAPSSPNILYQRLFAENTESLFEDKKNWDEQLAELEERRKFAMSKIFLAGGLKLVLEFVHTVGLPYQVGVAFGKISGSEIDPIILPKSLDNDEKSMKQFIAGFIWGRWQLSKWSWFDKLNKKKWPEVQIAKVLIYLPFTTETWSRAAFSSEVENFYWNNVIVNPYQSKEETKYAIKKLLEYGRPHAAINCLAKLVRDKEQIDSVQALKALKNAIVSNEDKNNRDIYNIQVIIKSLQNDKYINQKEISSVEWIYLPLLDRHDDLSPKFLERELATNPKFFCELIQKIYRSKKNKDDISKEPSENEKSIASNAYRLLNEWQLLPGSKTDGGFDGQEFIKWIDEVKKITTESGHLEVALIAIGNVLVHAPSDPDGLWIHHSVAEALNAKDADEIRQGFRIGLSNLRGVHWVDPTGKPERDLADEYIKKANEIEVAGYYRFAITLRELADSYKREAERIIVNHLKEPD